MATNGFREDELITRKVNGQTRVFPVVGGRLRLAHEDNEHLNLQTEMVSWDGQYAIFKCCAVTGKGQFVGYGTANSQRDTRLAESLVELAETRSIARALRFAGFGLEFCGAEEMTHIPEGDQEQQTPSRKGSERVFPDGNGEGKTETKPAVIGNGKATQAQCRALYALTKRALYTQEDIDGMLSSMGAASFQDLSREAASQIIGSLQAEVAA